VIGVTGTVDIGHNRGRLRPEAAASLARTDAALRAAGLAPYVDVNSAWRSPVLQQQLRDAYEAYLRGGPWAPIALKPEDSVHCDGNAIDSDHGHTVGSTADRILVEHGWILTVWRWVGGKLTLVEPWHREYQKSKDKHYGEPVPAASDSETLDIEEHDMRLIRIGARTASDRRFFLIGDDTAEELTRTEAAAYLYAGVPVKQVSFQRARAIILVARRVWLKKANTTADQVAAEMASLAASLTSEPVDDGDTPTDGDDG
jgi:hypothetical protein